MDFHGQEFQVLECFGLIFDVPDPDTVAGVVISRMGLHPPLKKHQFFIGLDVAVQMDVLILKFPQVFSQSCLFTGIEFQESHWPLLFSLRYPNHVLRRPSILDILGYLGHQAMLKIAEVPIVFLARKMIDLVSRNEIRPLKAGSARRNRPLGFRRQLAGVGSFVGDPVESPETVFLSVRYRGALIWHPKT